MGFEELAHMADWCVRVWGRDMKELLTESARAMNTLSGIRLNESRHESRYYEHQADDPESLLIAFLSELIYYQEQEGIAFLKFDIQMRNHHVVIQMQGAEITSMDKIIKAVTWHNLKILKTPSGLETEIVFDV